ncbi:MAG: GNAT family N-acetyltransferase [Gemmatimonadota bacterium]
MSLIFRNGGSEDIPAVASLGAHSFPAIGLSLQEWEESLRDSPRGGVETLWVGEREGRIVAACRLLRFQQWIGGVTIPMMGLSTVAIAPTHRRRGLAGQLVTTGLRHAGERGDAVSALFPFRTSFYRRLGYGMAGHALQYQFPPAALPDHPSRARVEIAESQEARAEIASVYGRWAPGQTGQLERPDRAWSLVWQKGSRHGALYRSPAGEPTGYAVFRYLTDPTPQGRVVDVEEIAWLEPQARLGLLGWLASLSDQWEQILYRAHPDEGFAEHLSELRHPVDGVPRWHFWFPSATLLEGPMFRIIDMEGAWSARRVDSTVEVAVALEVHDPQLPENEGGWTLTASGGRVEVTRGAGPDRCDVSVRTSIEVLSRLFIGSLSPSAAAVSGLLEVDSEDALPDLDRLLRLPRPWMFDRF